MSQSENKATTPRGDKSRTGTPRGATPKETPRGPMTPRDGHPPPVGTPRDRSARGMNSYRNSTKRTGGTATAVNVCVRLRPISSTDAAVMNYSAGADGTMNINVKDEQRAYEFSKVFDCTSTEPEVFEYLWPKVADQIRGGFNATVMCYGQTGSGKTHTLNNMYPTLMKSIFQLTQEDSGNQNTFAYHVAYIQIYRDVAYDLLDKSTDKYGTPLAKPNGMRTPEPRVAVTSAEELVRLIDQAQSRRAISAHALNNKSSRSHTLLFLYVTRYIDGVAITESKVAVVDLAGSERAKRTGATGEVFEESISINRSLSALLRVIESLSGQNGAVGIPFRENLLTLYLHVSLSNSYFALVANVNPELTNYDETRCTLDFATIAKKVVVTRTRNVARIRQDEWVEAAPCELESNQIQIISEISSLQHRVESLLAEVENSRKREEQMKARIQSLELDVDSMQALQKILTETSATAQLLDSQAEEFRAMLREREEELRDLQKVLAEKKSRSGEIDALIMRCRDAEDRAETNSQRVAAYEEKLQRAAQRDTELQAREAAVLAQEQELAHLRQVVQLQQSKLDLFQQNYPSTADSVQSQAQLEERIMELQAALRIEMERNKELHLTVEDLNTHISIMKEHESRLEEKVRDCDDNLLRAYLELDAQQSVVEVLQEKLQFANSRASEVVRTCEKLTTECEKVRQQLLARASHGPSEDSDELQRRLKHLEAERSQALTELRTMQKESTRWYKLLQERTALLERAQDKVSKLESGNITLQRSNGSLSKQIRDVSKKQHSIQEKLRVTEERNRVLTEGFEKFRATCATLSLKNEKLKSEQRILTQEVQQLSRGAANRSGSKSPLITCTSRTNTSMDSMVLNATHGSRVGFSRNNSMMAPPSYDEAVGIDGTVIRRPNRSPTVRK